MGLEVTDLKLAGVEGTNIEVKWQIRGIDLDLIGFGMKGLDAIVLEVIGREVIGLEKVDIGMTHLKVTCQIVSCQ